MEMLTMEETFIVVGLAVLIVGTAFGILCWWVQEKERKALEVVAKAPKADVVEVVRCKDCVYWEEHDGEMFCNCWANLMTDTAEYDYCSYGERKEDGGL